MANVEKINEAINILKEECSEHTVCSRCPLCSHGECTLSDEPWNWDNIDDPENPAV